MKAQRVKINQDEYGIDIVLAEDEMSDYVLEQISNSQESQVSAAMTTSYESSEDDYVQSAIAFTESSPTIGEAHYLIPEAALATYKQLLCTNSDRETIQYLMYIREHGEPEVEADGTNAWTSAYEELESKLELQANKGVTEEVEESDDDALSKTVAKVKSLSKSLAKATNNLISVASADDEEELTGIDKTRSKLGLPSRTVSKTTKLRLLKAASANIMTADVTSSNSSESTFYEISDDVLDLFDQDAVSKASAKFFADLTPDVK